MVSGAYFEQRALVHRDFLHKMAVRMTRNEDDAQDLVQETFLRAFRFFDRFEPGTNCRAWLRQILMNTFINRYRKDHRRPAEVAFDSIEGARESLLRDTGLQRYDPEEVLLNSVLKEDVCHAFVELPPDYRGAFSLSLLGGFSYREIADIMGCPIGTIMSRIHRARKLTQKRLLHYAEGRPRKEAQMGGTGAIEASAPLNAPPVSVVSTGRPLFLRSSPVT